MAVVTSRDPVLPGEHDVALAMTSSHQLAPLLSNEKKDISITVKADKKDHLVVLPFRAVKLLVDILTQMAEGNAVTLIPIHAELTTQQAADLLNISRPYLIKLMERGEIPFHKAGTHRRIYFSDLKKFKQKHDKISSKALSELVKQAQELGLGY